MDRLDTIIDNHVFWKTHDLLQELKQRRESNLRPADKFLNNTPLQQVDHIISELGEVLGELGNYFENGKEEALPNAILELVDLQMSCETMLAILGLDEQQRMEARRKVIEKNRARGYYNG